MGHKFVNLNSQLMHSQIKRNIVRLNKKTKSNNSMVYGERDKSYKKAYRVCKLNDIKRKLDNICNSEKNKREKGM